MNIKILTIHCIPNFGSVFQTYALSEHLKMCGYGNIEVIDYRPSYYKPHSLRTIIGMLLNLKKYIVRSRKFEFFIKENTTISVKEYHTLQQLIEAGIQADVVIAGGDQLWNVYHDCGKDDAYKLAFTNSKQISYATSMGQSGFTKEQLIELASKIRSFSAVSVRESSSVNQLQQVGIKAEQCVDPVYLLSAKQYGKFIKEIPHKHYLLVYLVTPSSLLDKTIKYLSEKYNLQVILCSGFSKKCQCDVFLSDLGPEEILSYIKHADIVLSASFHATTFSLIFQKQFFTILPDPNTNERIVDLLSTRGLSDRIVTETSDLKSCLSENIDYNNICSYEPVIEKSKAYLKRAIQ